MTETKDSRGFDAPIKYGGADGPPGLGMDKLRNPVP